MEAKNNNKKKKLLTQKPVLTGEHTRDLASVAFPLHLPQKYLKS